MGKEATAWHVLVFESSRFPFRKRKGFRCILRSKPSAQKLMHSESSLQRSGMFIARTISGVPAPAERYVTYEIKVIKYKVTTSFYTISVRAVLQLF